MWPHIGACTLWQCYGAPPDLYILQNAPFKSWCQVLWGVFKKYSWFLAQKFTSAVSLNEGDFSWKSLMKLHLLDNKVSYSQFAQWAAALKLVQAILKEDHDFTVKLLGGFPVLREVCSKV